MRVISQLTYVNIFSLILVTSTFILIHCEGKHYLIHSLHDTLTRSYYYISNQLIGLVGVALRLSHFEKEAFLLLPFAEKKKGAYWAVGDAETGRSETPRNIFRSTKR
ncbi:hypothetical protein GGS26DRAFT_537464 [Hypomontagnella submonticulosa]|nr:hypothetical protein GGS26DRAFT_537464 [Hypomontagnella submonticulosa]